MHVPATFVYVFLALAFLAVSVLDWSVAGTCYGQPVTTEGRPSADPSSPAHGVVMHPRADIGERTPDPHNTRKSRDRRARGMRDIMVTPVRQYEMTLPVGTGHL